MIAGDGLRAEARPGPAPHGARRAGRQADRGPGDRRAADRRRSTACRWRSRSQVLDESLDRPAGHARDAGRLHAPGARGDVDALERTDRRGDARRIRRRPIRLHQRRAQRRLGAEARAAARRRRAATTRWSWSARCTCSATTAWSRSCARKGYKVERMCSACEPASADVDADSPIGPCVARCRHGTAGSGGTSTMQSTGHAGTHSSQPVHSGSITVCMCLRAADDGVDRAGLDALGAADAVGFDDQRDLRRLVRAARAVEGLRRRRRAHAPARARRHRRRAGNGRCRRRRRPSPRRRAGSRRSRTGRIGSAAGCGRGVRSGRALRVGPSSARCTACALSFTGMPGCAPSSASSRCSAPPSKPADRIMPSLMPKRILRGARLAMNTTLRPTSVVRLAVAGADAGEDLALAEFAGVEFEAQQLVRAFDELARQHLADAQVELGEVVDADRRAGAAAASAAARLAGAAAGLAGWRRGGGAPVRLQGVLAGFGHGVDLLRVDAGEQRRVGVDAVRRAAARRGRSSARPARRGRPRPARATRGSTGFSAAASTRNRFRPCVHTACSSRVGAVLLGEHPRLVLVDVAVGLVGQRHRLAQHAGGLVALVGVARSAPAAATKRAYIAGSGSASASRPSKRLSMKPAQRLARLTNLPTRSRVHARDEVARG